MKNARKKALQRAQKPQELTVERLMQWLTTNCRFTGVAIDGEMKAAWIINRDVVVPADVAVAFRMWEEEFGGIVLREKDTIHLN